MEGDFNADIVGLEGSERDNEIAASLVDGGMRGYIGTLSYAPTPLDPGWEDVKLLSIAITLMLVIR